MTIFLMANYQYPYQKNREIQYQYRKLTTTASTSERFFYLTTYGAHCPAYHGDTAALQKKQKYEFESNARLESNQNSSLDYSAK